MLFFINLSRLFQSALFNGIQGISPSNNPVTTSPTPTNENNTDAFVTAPQNPRIAVLIRRLNDNPSTEEVINAIGELGRIGQGSSDARIALTSFLHDSDPSVRRLAAISLGNIGQGSPEAVAALIPLLRDSNESVRCRAAEALGNIGQGSSEVSPALISCIRNPSESLSVLRFALRALHNLGEDLPRGVREQAIEVLTPLLSHFDEPVKRSAIDILGRIGQDSPQAVRDQAATALGSLLNNDSNPSVIRTVITALENIGQDSPQAVRALFLFLRNYRSDPNIRTAAFEARDNILNNSQDAVGLLLPLLRDSDTSVRESAAIELGFRGQDSPEAVPALIRCLRDDGEDSVKEFAARALGRIGNGSQEAINALNPLLTHRNADIRVSAAAALAELGQSSPEVVRTLNSLLTDRSSFVKSSAARALARIGQNLPQTLRAQTISALNLLLNDNDTFVRTGAAEALVNLGHNSLGVARTLTSLLSDSSSQFADSGRAEAARILGLGNIGQNLPPDLRDQAAIALVNLLSDRNDTTRAFAARALGNLGDLPQDIRDRAARALIPLLGDANIPGNFVAETLGNLAQGLSPTVKDQTVTALIGALGNPDRDVQTAAASALANIGQAAVPQLIPLLASGQTTAEILSKIGEGAIPDLTGALTHENPVVRTNAAQTLGTMIELDGVRVSDQRLNEIITGIANIALNTRGISSRAVREDTRSAATQALGFIANNNQIPEALRNAATEALNRINQQSPL